MSRKLRDLVDQHQEELAYYGLVRKTFRWWIATSQRDDIEPKINVLTRISGRSEMVPHYFMDIRYITRSGEDIVMLDRHITNSEDLGEAMLYLAIFFSMRCRDILKHHNEEREQESVGLWLDCGTENHEWVEVKVSSALAIVERLYSLVFNEPYTTNAELFCPHAEASNRYLKRV